MPASNTYSADAPTIGQSHTSLNEPSMEDILASIRRIIAEDQSNNLGRSGLTGLARRASQPAPAPPKESTEPASPHADMISPVPPTTDAALIGTPVEAEVLPAPASSGVTDDEPPRTEVDLRGSHDPVDHEHTRSQDDEGDVRSASAFGLEEQPVLTHATGHDDPDHGFELGEVDQLPSVSEQEPLISSAAGASITSSFQTLADTVLMQDPGLIERIMRETLRPMLKSWLDDHLPSLVERLVRAEIERVARGGRSRD